MVNFDGYANMQSLIDSFRKRLCFKATPEAKGLAEDFKLTLHLMYPSEADVLVPNCIYRGGCPEFTSCGFYKRFLEFCEEYTVDLSDLQARYDAYNDMFDKQHEGWK